MEELNANIDLAANAQTDQNSINNNNNNNNNNIINNNNNADDNADSNTDQILTLQGNMDIPQHQLLSNSLSKHKATLANKKRRKPSFRYSEPANRSLRGSSYNDLGFFDIDGFLDPNAKGSIFDHNNLIDEAKDDFDLNTTESESCLKENNMKKLKATLVKRYSMPPIRPGGVGMSGSYLQAKERVRQRFLEKSKHNETDTDRDEVNSDEEIEPAKSSEDKKPEMQTNMNDSELTQKIAKENPPSASMIPSKTKSDVIEEDTPKNKEDKCLEPIKLPSSNKSPETHNKINPKSNVPPSHMNYSYGAYDHLATKHENKIESPPVSSRDNSTDNNINYTSIPKSIPTPQMQTSYSSDETQTEQKMSPQYLSKKHIERSDRFNGTSERHFYAKIGQSEVSKIPTPILRKKPVTNEENRLKQQQSTDNISKRDQFLPQNQNNSMSRARANTAEPKSIKSPLVRSRTILNSRTTEEATDGCPEFIRQARKIRKSWDEQLEKRKGVVFTNEFQSNIIITEREDKKRPVSFAYAEIEPNMNSLKDEEKLNNEDNKELNETNRNGYNKVIINNTDKISIKVGKNKNNKEINQNDKNIKIEKNEDNKEINKYEENKEINKTNEYDKTEISNDKRGINFNIKKEENNEINKKNKYENNKEINKSDEIKNKVEKNEDFMEKTKISKIEGKRGELTFEGPLPREDKPKRVLTRTRSDLPPIISVKPKYKIVRDSTNTENSYKSMIALRNSQSATKATNVVKQSKTKENSMKTDNFVVNSPNIDEINKSNDRLSSLHVCQIENEVVASEKNVNDIETIDTVNQSTIEAASSLKEGMSEFSDKSTSISIIPDIADKSNNLVAIAEHQSKSSSPLQTSPLHTSEKFSHTLNSNICIKNSIEEITEENFASTITNIEKSVTALTVNNIVESSLLESQKSSQNELIDVEPPNNNDYENESQLKCSLQPNSTLPISVDLVKQDSTNIEINDTKKEIMETHAGSNIASLNTNTDIISEKVANIEFSYDKNLAQEIKSSPSKIETYKSKIVSPTTAKTRSISLVFDRLPPSPPKNQTENCIENLKNCFSTENVSKYVEIPCPIEENINIQYVSEKSVQTEDRNKSNETQTSMPDPQSPPLPMRTSSKTNFIGANTNVKYINQNSVPSQSSKPIIATVDVKTRPVTKISRTKSSIMKSTSDESCDLSFYPPIRSEPPPVAKKPRRFSIRAVRTYTSVDNSKANTNSARPQSSVWEGKVMFEEVNNNHTDPGNANMMRQKCQKSEDNICEKRWSRVSTCSNCSNSSTEQLVVNTDSRKVSFSNNKKINSIVSGSAGNSKHREESNMQRPYTNVAFRSKNFMNDKKLPESSKPNIIPKSAKIKELQKPWIKSTTSLITNVI